MALINTCFFLYRIVHLKLRKVALLGLVLFTIALYIPSLKAQVKSEHLEWSNNSPLIYYVGLQDAGQTLRGEVRISYYVYKKGYPYYRRAITPDRVFGESFDIYNSDVFRVKIEFRAFPKERPVDDLYLVIPSNFWLSTGGCFLEPNLLNLPLKIPHGKDQVIGFQLQENCNELSNIKLDFKFSKNGSDLSFKTSKSRKGKLKGKKKSRKTVSVDIPLIVKQAPLISKKETKRERVSKIDDKTTGTKAILKKEKQNQKPKTSAKEKVSEVASVSNTSGKKSTRAQKNEKNKIKENEAFKEAKESDTVEAYEDFANQFPKSKELPFVNKRILDIQQLDKKAWETVIANNAEPCDKTNLLEIYLQNSQHHTTYRDLAEKERLKAAALCKTNFRIQNSTSKSGQGHYTFEIINGQAPYSATVNNNDANIRVDGNNIILDILEGGSYELIVKDQSSPTPLSYEHNLDATHPDFEIELNKEQILIRGGQGSFHFATNDNDQYQITERKTELSDLIRELNKNITFTIFAVDLNGNQSNKIQIPVAQSSSSNFWNVGGIVFILTLLASFIYFLKDKISSLFQKTNLQEKEEEGLWKMAQENTDWKIYEIYKKEYPNGKYINQLASIKLEFDFWKSCQQDGNYRAYLQNYGTGRFRALAEKKLSES